MATAIAKITPKLKLSREQLRALSEIERQQYYISRLPKSYKFPLFSGRQAVMSQRQSGYRTTARAAREIIDNALEAGAKNIRVIFDQPNDANRERNERRSNVRAVAFIDDGPGMPPAMARYALTWGGGTHSDDPNYIGKFGFGLPNSSINQCMLVQVFSRTAEDQPWHRVQLDIASVKEFDEITVPEGEASELPAFVTAYLRRNKVGLKHGTVVLWVRPDRLTYNSAANLKDHLLDDFGVTYRYMLPRFETEEGADKPKMIFAGKVRLYIEERPVETIDPLFLTPGSRLYLPPNKEDLEKSGAWETFGGDQSDGRTFGMKHYIDEETGARRLALLRSEEELEQARKDEKVLAVGYIHVRVARMPVGFVDGVAKNENPAAYARFQVRQARRGVSFVRADREIETLDAFPRTVQDKAANLGNWPHISTYAYHFGVEVRFDPELDDAFGVGNDKQTIRPIDDFWRVMSSEDIALDKAVRVEEKYQMEKRERKDRKKREPGVTNPQKTEPASSAAEAASQALGQPKKVPDYRAPEAQRLLEESARKRAELNNESVEVARKAIEQEARRKRFMIDFFSSNGGVFYRPSLGNGAQRVAEINKEHPFYQVFYSRLAEMSDPIARQTVDLLLLTLAQAELNADEELASMYETQRESAWSPFLKLGLKRLEELEPQKEEERINDE